MANQLSIKHALTNFQRDVSRRRSARIAASRFSIIVLAASMSALVGCGGSLSGGSSSAGSTNSSSPGSAQCADSSGLASQDLAGQCRGTSLTMGALEVDAGAASAAGIQAAAGTSVTAAPGSLQIAWQPIGNTAAGYMVYYGRTADTASVLVSDVPTSGLTNPAAPSVTYDPARDLGLFAGDTACFRIFAYDMARALSSESTVVCATA